MGEWVAKGACHPETGEQEFVLMCGSTELRPELSYITFEEYLSEVASSAKQRFGIWLEHQGMWLDEEIITIDEWQTLLRRYIANKAFFLQTSQIFV